METAKKPLRIFTKDPAITTIIRLYMAWLSNSSSSIATYPPIGKTLIEYFVSPLFQLKIGGPKPIEKAVTFILLSFAVEK